jgi:hypothetical protein
LCSKAAKYNFSLRGNSINYKVNVNPISGLEVKLEYLIPPPVDVAERVVSRAWMGGVLHVAVRAQISVL